MVCVCYTINPVVYIGELAGVSLKTDYLVAVKKKIRNKVFDLNYFAV